MHSIATSTVRISAYVLSLGALASCATASLAPPPRLDAPPVYVSRTKPTNAQKPAAHAVPDSYFGVTDARSGSVPLGLLLGPLGVLANVAIAERAASSRAGGHSILKDDLSEDLVAAGFPIKPEAPAHAGGHFELTPVALLVYESDSSLRLTCVVHAAHFRNGERTWGARYAVGAEGLHTMTSAEQSQALRGEIRSCLGRAAENFRWHLKNPEGGTVTRQVRFRDATEGQPVTVAASFLPTRLVMPDRIGLMEFPARSWRLAD